MCPIHPDLFVCVAWLTAEVFHSGDFENYARDCLDARVPVLDDARALPDALSLGSLETTALKTFSVCAIAVILASLVYACGSPSPTAPSAPTTVVAAISIQSITATSETTATGFLYDVTYQLRETGSRSAATFSGLTYSFSNGTSTDGTLNGTVKVASGGSVNVGPVNITDNTGRGIASSVTIGGTFSDDNGHTGSASGSASIAAPSAPTPAPAVRTFNVTGAVTDGTSHGVLPNIRIDLGDTAGGVSTTTTNGSGTYTFMGIATGSYTVTASAVSYLTTSQSITVSLSDVRTDIVLPRGGGSAPGPSQSLTCNGAIVPATVSCPNNQGLQAPTAECNDGTFSCSQNRSGTCSTHSGVRCYVCPGALC
jgi:hypothetical protein